MPLQVPPIDARSYRQLLDDMLARIPVHTPEWTNRNDADPGVTLLQLFAYMGESILYRAGLIPERNRLAFLRLLGYDRLAASAARGVVAFDGTRRGTTVVVQPDLPLAASEVPFRSDNGLAVLPVESVVFVKRRAELSAEDAALVDAEYQGFVEPGIVADYYESVAVDWTDPTAMPLELGSTVDGTIWVALLARAESDVAAARAAMADQVLTLGVVPDADVTRKTLPAGGPDPQAYLATLEFQRPAGEVPLSLDAAERVPSYAPIPSTSSVDVLSTVGVVQLELPGAAGLATWPLEPAEAGVGAFPPALEDADAVRLVTWLRIRPTAAGDGVDEASALAAVRLRWLGINAATVRQRARVEAEVVGRGTGAADQRMTLANTPVLLDTLELTVGGEVWEAVDDLATAAAEAQVTGSGATVLATDATGADIDRSAVFTVDRGSGEIVFGDGIHGRRPPSGALVRASYDHGGGTAGMVGTEAITRGTLPQGVSVSNPLPTWGGAEAESLDDAERSVAAFVRHRDRLVTTADVVDITKRTPGVELARVEVLPLVDPTLPDVSSPGALTVLLIPAVDPEHPATPEPDRFVLDAVCAHLDPRRLVTSEIHLSGPDYVDVWVSVGIEILGGSDLAVVREAVKAAIASFLSPLTGGHVGGGWPLSTDVERLGLWAQAARVEGVAKVNGTLLAGGDGVDVDRIGITGLQLPRLVGVSVRRGDPTSIADVQGLVPTAEPGRLPIPFVPVEC